MGLRSAQIVVEAQAMPVLFVSHGAPTYATDPGLAGQQLAQLGRRLTTPRAILAISPHWITRSIEVAAAPQPHTIHDFGGFSPELYKIQYAAQGHPVLAKYTSELLTTAGWQATLHASRGLDHGVWVPLLHLFSSAHVPVFQVSMPRDLDEISAFKLGRSISCLAADGVLVLTSGSLTHNLYELSAADGRAPAYVAEFTSWVRSTVVSGNWKQLERALTDAPHAARAHPTPEHFLPLLIAAGAAEEAGYRAIDILDGGVRHGVLAMESYCFTY
jgi:4,5-DOPA dioxygenase extradiol